MEGRLCPVCREFKPLAEYGKRMRNGKNIGQAYCKPCKLIIDRDNQRLRREIMKNDRAGSGKENQEQCDKVQ